MADVSSVSAAGCDALTEAIRAVEPAYSATGTARISLALAFAVRFVGGTFDTTSAAGALFLKLLNSSNGATGTWGA